MADDRLTYTGDDARAPFRSGYDRIVTGDGRTLDVRRAEHPDGTLASGAEVHFGFVRLIHRAGGHETFLSPTEVRSIVLSLPDQRLELPRDAATYEALADAQSALYAGGPGEQGPGED